MASESECEYDGYPEELNDLKMISYSEIEAESAKIGVSVATIEKDYHLDWYLTGLLSANLFSRFSFYGGTAIKKIYIPNNRFSEDIDLISGGKLDTDSISQILDRAHQFLGKETNLFYFYRPEEIQVAGTQTRFVVHYRGFSEIGGVKRFLLDFAQGIEELSRPIAGKLLTVYRDLIGRKIEIPTMPIEIICAEKLALIADRKRKEPRDIYDLWSVLTQIKKFDRRLFLSRFHGALSYSVDFSVLRSFFKDSDLQRAWEVRLRHQVPDLPDFNVVALELTSKCEVIFKKDKI